MAPSACPACGSSDGSGHSCPAKTRLVGQLLDGRYFIETVLGQGGMGMVFRAVQTSMQRPVALKTLHPSLAAAPAFFERFRREAEVASRLRHPNIITVYDFGRSEDGTCYYVMELVEGQSLKQLVKAGGPLPLGRAVGIMEMCVGALAHAHAQGVIHRDLKPHNIMVQTLDGKDFAKVLDFGLVKALEHEDDEPLTSTGQVLGTPQYMPPEQAGGELADHRSDLYALGGVFYYCLTGSSPYGAKSVRQALQAALRCELVPVNDRRPSAPVPAAFDDFFKKALAPAREDRFQSAEAFIEGIRAAIAGVPSEALSAQPDPSDSLLTATGREGMVPSASDVPKGPPPRRRTGSSSRRSSASRPPAEGSGPRSNPRTLVTRGQGPTQLVHHTEPELALRSAGRARVGRQLALGLVVLGLLGAGYLLFLPAPPLPGPALSAPTLPTDPPPIASDEPVPIAPVGERTEEVLVRLESSPTGAGIFDGQVQVGTTPQELRLKRGTHSYTFRLGGYEPTEKTFDLSRLASSTFTLKAQLRRSGGGEAVQPAATKRPDLPKKTLPRRIDDIPVFE